MSRKPSNVQQGYWAGLLMGAIITALFLRLRQQSEPHDERTLLRDVANPGFSPAAALVMQLYREGKLSGETSILRGKNLTGANWQRVVMPKVDLESTNLEYADLRDALLDHSNLTKTDFRYANLAGADLRGVKLPSAQFMQAKLSHANLAGARATRASLFMTIAVRAKMSYITLDGADLQEADLHGTDLKHANLSKTLLRDTNFAEANLEKALLGGAAMMNANLTGANLSGAHFSNKTILPDAKWVGFDENRHSIFDKYWTPETDMTRYTDLNHHDFWQPSWVQKCDWVKRNYEED